MQISRHSGGLLIVLYLAVVGYLLVTLPPRVIAEYHATSERNPTIATVYLMSVIAGAVILGGLSVWMLARVLGSSRRKQRRQDRRNRDPSKLTTAEQQREFEDNLARGGDYAATGTVSEQLRQQIRGRMDELEAKRRAEQLEIVAFGTISSGKSSLLNALAGREVFRSDVLGGTTASRSEIPWPGKDRVVLSDTPGLAEVEGEVRAAAAATAAKDADVVLFIVDGPLKHYERQLLEQLTEMEKRIVVCLNKTDWFGDRERDELLAQIAEQVPREITADDIVAVRSQGGTRRRVRVMADGREAEEIVTLEPDIELLAKRMLRILERDGRDLLLANLLMQSRGLVDDARERVMESLDRHARQVIHKYMWAAGTATAVNPIPLLDLAGGTAVSVKMVLDLAHVYRQEIDADTVITMIGQLGKNLAAMLGATAVTPALAAALGTMLKTVPGIGTIAGGLLQGTVQAVVTLWIGRVFANYFRNEMKPPAGGLAELARREWEQVTSAGEIKKLVTEGRLRDRNASEPADG